MSDKAKIIGIFYIIFGLLGLLGLPLIFVQHKFLAFLFSNIGRIDPQAEAIIQLIQELVAILIPALIALVVVHVVVNVLVGICFIKRKLYWTCMVASILTCLFFPLGTLLGVFAIMVLIDEQIKSEFNLPVSSEDSKSA